MLTLTLKKTPFKFDYTLGDIILNRVAVQKNLGIFIDSRLTFVPQLSLIEERSCFTRLVLFTNQTESRVLYNSV